MVTAVIHADSPAAGAVADAVRAQQPDGGIVVAGPHAAALASGSESVVHAEPAAGRAGAFAAAIPVALEAGADWVWLLDGHAVPAEGALRALLDAADHPDLPAPAVLAGKVIEPGGDLHPDALPWPEIFEKEVSTAACAHRLVSLRAARAGSTLVSRAAIERHGAPEPRYGSHGETLEWTARILRENAGYLVPAALAVRSDREPRDPRRDLANRLTMLRGDSWRREEKLWFGFLLVQDAVRAAAGRA